MTATCIACDYDAHVTIVLDEKSELGVLGAFAPKSFCAHCMYRISKAYNSLNENNFFTIPEKGYEYGSRTS